jgi:hypothetical protein
VEVRRYALKMEMLVNNDVLFWCSAYRLIYFARATWNFHASCKYVNDTVSELIGDRSNGPENREAASRLSRIY